MKKARFELRNVKYGVDYITTGSISIGDSYCRGSFQTSAIFTFNVPKGDNIFKKYWKKATIKGYKSFSAEMTTVKYGGNTYSSEDSALTKNLSNIYGNTYIDSSVDKNGIIYSDNYLDTVVEGYIEYGETHDTGIVFSVMTRSTSETVSGSNVSYHHKFTIGDIQNIYLEVEYDDFGYDVVPVFPVNVSIKPTQDNNFAFQLNSTGHSRSSFSVSDIKLTVHQNDEDYEYTLSDGQTYQTIEAGTLVVGQATYDIVANNTYDEPNTSGTIHFTCVGPSEAPTITSVTQNSFPTISWTSSNQRAWELIVRNANGIVFDSGMTAGSAKSCKLNKMLQNGAYYAELRVLNTFGYYTDWDTYGFTLTPTAPAAPTDILVSVTNDYGVAVDCKAPTNAGTLYVVRRKNSADDPVIIGKYESGFVDYTIPLNTTYEYTVRNYSTGCADGAWMDVTVNAPGIIIRDGEDIEQFVHLWKVESGEFDLMRSDVRSNTLMQCVGRTYPVKESGEWITASRNVDVFVPVDSYDTLVDMAVNSKFVYLQNKGEFLPCNLELDDDGEFISSGRLTKVILTRIDEV